MHHYLLGFWYALRDMLLAGLDLVTGRRRRRYDYALTIDAPVGHIWPLLTGDDITYEKINLRVTREPLPGIDNGYVGRMTMPGHLLPEIAYQIVGLREPAEIGFRYLPEHSDAKALLGDDDLVGYRVEPLDPHRTRLHAFRELSHKQARSRIVAPIGLRSASWLIKQQAELANGNSGAPASLGNRALRQGLIAAATLASFWFIAGLTDALLLIVIIALHELGHAVAMLMTGVGVRFVTLVPFFGGMAMPKRHYDTQWKVGFVAWAGPGFSLLPTLALSLYAWSSGCQMVAHAAALFAAINGINLLPLAPLDGGVMVNSLLASLHRQLARAVLALGAVTLLALAIYLQSMIIGVVFVFAAMQLVYQISFNLDEQRQKLRWFQWPAILIALVGTIGAYVVLFVRADQLDRPRLDLGEMTDRPVCPWPWLDADTGSGSDGQAEDAGSNRDEG
jgi:Zn-dependent protease